MRRTDRRARGFSLIEMLVAMAVFSLVALALLNLAGENTRTAVVIEERVLAGVVADNRAVEAMLATPSQLGASTAGSESAGSRDWRWTRTISPTDMAEIVRVDVTVMPAAEERVVAETSVFRSMQ